MNARIMARVLGASAALALLIPAAAPASAQAWNGDYGRGPAMGYPPPGYQGYQGNRDYAAPPDSGIPPDYRSQNQDFPPPDYGPPESAAPYRYGPSQEYGASETYGPNGIPGPNETYGANETYGPGEEYGSEGAAGRSLYRAPEVPPLRQGYAGSSAEPERYGAGHPGAGWETPPTEWSAPRAGAGHVMPAPRGQLVSAVDLNLRAGPSNGAPVRSVLPAGTPVRVTGFGQGGWVQVASPFGPGWVYGRYLART